MGSAGEKRTASGWQRFLTSLLSVRWQLLVPLLVLLGLIHLAGYGLFLRHVDSGYAQLSQQRTEQLQLLLQGSLSNNYQRLQEDIQLFTAIPQLADDQGYLSAVKVAVDQRFNNLAMFGLLEHVALYSSTGQLLQRWGGVLQDMSPAVSAALLNEMPVMRLYCERQCTQLVVVPLLREGALVGAMLLARPIQELVLGFKRQTGVDVGLLRGQPGQPDWQQGVMALTNRNQSTALLKQWLKLDEKGQSLPLPAQGKYYQVQLLDLEGRQSTDHFWALIDDRSEQAKLRQQALHQTAWLTLLSWLASGLLSLLLVSYVCRRLKAIQILVDKLCYQVGEACQLELSGFGQWTRIKRQLQALLASTEKNQSHFQHSQQRLAESRRQLDQERQFNRELVAGQQQVVLSQNLTGQLMSLNEQGRELFGLERFEEMEFSQLCQRLNPEDDSQQAMATLYFGTETQLRTETQWADHTGLQRRLLWFHSKVPAGEGQLQMILSYGIDITEHLQAEGRLAWYGWQQRGVNENSEQLLMRHMPVAIEQSLLKNRKLALLFCDFSGLQTLEDDWDRQQMLEFVEQLWRGLKAELRDSDLVIPLGNEVFTVMLEGIRQRQSALDVIDKLQRRFAAQVAALSGRHQLQLTVGVSFAPEDGVDVSSLLYKAEQAMHLAYRDKQPWRSASQQSDTQAH